LAKGGCEDNN